LYEDIESEIEVEGCSIEIDNIEECLVKAQRGKGIVSVNAQKFADKFLRRHPTICVIESKEILTYVNGKYIANGKELIHQSLVASLAPYEKVDGEAAYSTYLFREVLDIIKGMTYIHASDIDADLNVINVQNGLLNWRTLELIPHSPYYYSRIQHPIMYDPKAECPSIEKIFNTVLRSEDYFKALEFIAYCLYRAYPIQKAFILLGPGGTGKTQFIDIVCRLLGAENVSSTSMHDLETDRFATSDLFNKCLNQFGDMEQTVLPNVNILKMLTSGKDRVRAQRKREHPFDFVNFAKFLMATNKLPYVKDDTTGFYRRIEILPFDHVFTEAEKDQALLDAATSSEELSGLLNMVIPHLDVLISRGNFSNSFTVTDAKMKYKAASDPIGTFVEEHIEEVAGEMASKDDVYEAYRAFCIQHEIQDPLCKSWFGRQFAKQIAYWKKDGIRNVNGELKTVWLNMRLLA
jgi:putative DNA primase/helicase